MTVEASEASAPVGVAASLAAAAPALRRVRAAPARPHVTTVLLACDGSAWLPRTLAAFSAQRRPSDVVVTVDAASRDDSESQLLALSRRLPGAGVRHVRVSAAATVLDAAQAALSLLDADRLDDDAEGRAGERDREEAATRGGSPVTARDASASWVWLLHDDSAPEPDALERLLEAVEMAPHVAVAGPKLTDWDDRRRLQEVGFTASRRGRVIARVDRGESDQGQRDDVSDVLAVSSAGMLLRADVLVALGNDPAAERRGEALDLCRRAHLAGHRVVVVPQAVVHHADASTTGARHGGTGRGGPDARRASRASRAAARRAEVHHQLVIAPLLALPVVVVLTAIGAVVRALGRMATKQPSLAPVELSSVAGALAGTLRPGRVWRARASWRRAVPAGRRDGARDGARDGRRALAALQPGTVELFRFHRDRLARGDWSAREASPASAGESGAAAADGAARGTGDDPLPFEPPSRIGRTAVPLVLLALAGTSAWVLRGLLGPGQVTGPALPGAPPLGALVRALASDWSPAGLGAPLPPDPLLWVVAAASLPLGGDTALAVAALLLLALPLAGWAAWAAAGLATRSRPLRLLAALVWAAAPPLLLGLDTGRLGAVVAHVALPWVVLGGARALAAPSRRVSLTAAASGGLAAAVAVAAAPVLAPGLVVAVVVAALFARRWRTSLVWLLAPAAALVAPLAVVAASDPRALVAGPGFALAAAAPAWWELLLGQPAATGPGWVAQLVPGSLPALAERAGALGGTAPGALGDALSRSVPALVTGTARWLPLALPAAAVVVTAVAAWARRRTGSGVRTGWMLVAVGALTAAVSVHTAVAPPAVTAWPGAGSSLLWLGSVTGALLVAERVRSAVVHPARSATATSRRVARSRWRTPAVALACVVALAPLGGLAGWALSSPSQLERGTGALPAVALDAGRGPDAARTLELDLRGLREDPEGASAAVTLARGRVTLLDTSAAASAAALEGPLLGRATATASEGGEDDAATPGTAAVPGTALLRSVSAALAAGSGDPGPTLRSLGIGFVFVRGESPLDGSSALVRAGATDEGVLYRVATQAPGAIDRPARARLLGADGAALAVLPSAGERVLAEVPPGAQGRRAVLAERYDPGWRATLDGRPLTVTRTDGWATSVDVPAGGGDLVVSHAGTLPLVLVVAQGVVLLLTVLLALPLGGGARYRGPDRRAAA